MHKGSCLCGAVAFEVAGELPPPNACHCNQCRKQSGHYWASTDVARSAVTIHGEDQLSWYRATEKVRRGVRVRETMHARTSIHAETHLSVQR